jgi:hypothetical protein
MFGLNAAKINADRPWWSHGAQKGRSRPLAGPLRGPARSRARAHGATLVIAKLGRLSRDALSAWLAKVWRQVCRRRHARGERDGRRSLLLGQGALGLGLQGPRCDHGGSRPRLPRHRRQRRRPRCGILHPSSPASILTVRCRSTSSLAVSTLKACRRRAAARVGLPHVSRASRLAGPLTRGSPVLVKSPELSLSSKIAYTARLATHPDLAPVVARRRG